MPRTGRPKVDNPRNTRIVIRFTDEEYERIKKYAKEHNLSVTATIRKGVSTMLESKQ